MSTQRKPRKNKKFRFQLLADWIQTHFPNVRLIADIGGGKGLLSYFLNGKGYNSTVIDPNPQSLPIKYTDVHTKKRIWIPESALVKHIDSIFIKELTKDFDLIVGLHVHGSCIKIIESALEYKKNFVLIPCCVIDEPIEKLPNINWTQSLIELCEKHGLPVKTDLLNFAGNEKVIYIDCF